MIRRVLPVVFFSILLAACGGGAVPRSPTPPPERPAPTVTEEVEEPGLPAIVDAQELFVVDAEDGEPVLIHRTAGHVGRSVWSPDGSKLAFASGNRVYIADLLEEAVEPAAEAGSVHELMWSPKGDRIAYQATKSTVSEPIVIKIAVLDTASSAVRELLSGGEDLRLIAWFPNGEDLLLVRGGQLWRVDAASATAMEITSPLGDSIGRAALSPDGSQVALVVEGEGGGCQFGGSPGTLAIVGVADGARSEPLSGLCGISDVAWSPDGTQIAYPVVEGEKGTYVLDVATGQSRRLTAPERFDRRVEWLADRSALVVNRGCVQCDDPSAEFVFVPAEGGSEQPLLQADFRFAGFGGFAPDARRYLYSDDAVRVGTLGGEARALTAPDAESGYVNLSWSPAGGRVAYVRVPNQATRRYAVDVETGEVERLPAPPEGSQVSPDGRAWSPDGREVAFWRDTYEPDNWVRRLYVVSVETGQERELARFKLVSSVEDKRPAWSPDGRRIAVYVGAEVDPGIYVVEADGTGMTYTVAASSNRGYGDIAWSADGRQILLTSLYQGI